MASLLMLCVVFVLSRVLIVLMPSELDSMDCASFCGSTVAVAVAPGISIDVQQELADYKRKLTTSSILRGQACQAAVYVASQVVVDK